MKKQLTFYRLPILCALISLLIAFSAHAQLKARITVTQSKLDSVCGSHNIKLVFMCQNLAWIVDFSQATPQIQQISGVASASLPVISSDGRWLTYQTGTSVEGPSTSANVAKPWIRECAAAGSAAAVADTGYVPRFVQNTSSDTPEIIYSTSVACPAVQGVQICYDAGRTLKRKIIGKVPQSPEVVCANGSYYGGVSWDNRYLNTGWEGGPNGFILDLTDPTGTPHAVHTMRTLKIKKDSTAADTFAMVAIGTCNISRPASRIFTNTMLYFDFGSGAIAAAGCYDPLLGAWKMHEKLFISRYDAEDLKVFEMPADRPLVPLAQASGAGEAVGKSWDNPEWSNHPYLAVGTLLIDRLFKIAGVYQHALNHESIYLIDLKDSSFVKLIETTDSTYATQVSFLNPFIWVQIPASFTEDSTWLAKTIWEKAGYDVAGKPTIGVKRNVVAPRNFSALPTLRSTSRATRIVVYSALGQQIADFSKPLGKEINLMQFLKGLRPGIYLVGMESPGQIRRMYRWVN